MADMLAANRVFLDDIEPDSAGAVIENSQLIGRVVIERDARIVNSVIRGPATIGQRTEISDSYVGPYTSIYHDCQLMGTTIENSIVLERCLLDNPGTPIHDSMIGRDVIVRNDGQEPRAMRLVLGDHSQVYVP
jgi:glucose-1-phosphate thymidylyltransferase